MLRIGIINVTGYMGAEAARLLHAHPDVQVVSVTGRSAAGKHIAEVYPHLASIDLVIENEVGEVDAIVSALPHAASAEALRPHVERGTPVVDLSADFRLRNVAEYERWYDTHPAPELLNAAVFGLPELHREAIASAKLVASPGCHATAAVLALAPAIKRGLVEADIIVDSKAGISGAGRALGLQYHFSEANENVAGYALRGHRHLPEMVQELGALWEGPAPRITFVPHLVPATRGILATCYTNLKKDIAAPGETTHLVANAYKEFYDGSPFVRIVDEPPTMKQTLGSNVCLVHPVVDAPTGRLVVIACLDNLVKGGAGQGVQCLNLMFGLQETAGLDQLALYP